MTGDTFKLLATALLILSCGLDVIHCCSKAPEPEPTKLKCFHKTNNPDGQKGPCCEREYKPSVTDHEGLYLKYHSSSDSLSFFENKFL